MFVNPNFQVEKKQNSVLVSLKCDDKGVVDSFLLGENVGLGGTVPVIASERIDKTRILLCKTVELSSMWLYSDGKIKIGR